MPTYRRKIHPKCEGVLRVHKNLGLLLDNK
jgi:hypothetical protein